MKFILSTILIASAIVLIAATSSSSEGSDVDCEHRVYVSAKRREDSVEICLNEDQHNEMKSAQAEAGKFARLGKKQGNKPNKPNPKNKKALERLAPCLVPGVETLWPSNTSLSEWLADWGNLEHKTPLCVVKPATAEQAADVLRAARKHKIRTSVKAPEQSHSTAGQTQVDGGVVISTDYFLDIEIQPQNGWARFGSAYRWKTVWEALGAAGARAVMHTDTPTTSLAGTASVGGHGALSATRGTLGDHILEMEVVTGRGEVLIASREENVELFNAVRGGLGQYGVITWIKFEIVPVGALVEADYISLATTVGTISPVVPLSPGPTPYGPPEVIQWTFFWFDPSTFFDAALYLASQEDLDGFETFYVPLNEENLLAFIPPELAAIPEVVAFLNLLSGGTPPPAIYVMIIVDFPDLLDDEIATLASTYSGVLFSALPLVYFQYALRQVPLIASFQNLPTYWQPKLVFAPSLPFTAEAKPVFLATVGAMIAAGGAPAGGALSSFRTNAIAPDFSYQIPRVPLVVNIYLFIGAAQDPATVHLSEWQQTKDLFYSLIQPLYGLAASVYPQYKFYPQGYPPYAWSQHYDGTQIVDFETVRAWKRFFDPSNILGGSTIFEQE